MYLPQPSPIRIVSRSKLSGLGEHWGVELPDGRVIHLTPSGVALVSGDEFAQGLIVREVRQARKERHVQIMWRVAQSLQQPLQYRLLDQNCETFANHLLGDPPKSPQVAGVAILAAIVIALKFAA